MRRRVWHAAEELRVGPSFLQIGSVQAVQCVYRQGGPRQLRSGLLDCVGNTVELCSYLGDSQCLSGRNVPVLDCGSKRSRRLHDGCALGIGHLPLRGARYGKDPARRQERKQSDREFKAPARLGKQGHGG